LEKARLISESRNEMSRIFSRASWSGRSITEKQNKKKEDEIKRIFDVLDVFNHGYLRSEVVRDAIKISGLDPRTSSLDRNIRRLIDEEGKVKKKRKSTNSLVYWIRMELFLDE
jgi:Ca2+-binding EF-hand superfamily protein